jgi:hypothetical protein
LEDPEEVFNADEDPEELLNDEDDEDDERGEGGVGGWERGDKRPAADLGERGLALADGDVGEDEARASGGMGEYCPPELLGEGRLEPPPFGGGGGGCC